MNRKSSELVHPFMEERGLLSEIRNVHNILSCTISIGSNSPPSKAHMFLKNPVWISHNGFGAYYTLCYHASPQVSGQGCVDLPFSRNATR
jgi:hypothetical protein